MTLDEILKKAREGTVTIREVTEHLKASPGLSKNKKEKLQTLLNSGFKNMEIDPDLPFSELSKEEFVAKFSKDASPDKKGRLTSLQILNEMTSTFRRRGVTTTNEFNEPLYQDLEEVAREDVKVKKFQSRGERPMQGLITQVEMQEIYDTNLKNVDPEMVDALNFSRITGVRPSHITTGTDERPHVNQITKDNVIIRDDRITIRGVFEGKKRRPDITVSTDSTLGQLIVRSYERPGKYLFNVKKSSFDTAFRKHISPTLLAEHFEKLPLNDEGNRMSSSMVARAAFSKQLADEFKIGELETEFMMGQKPKSILRRSYAGDPDLAYEDFTGLTSGDRTVDIDPETGKRSQTTRVKTPEELKAESKANIARQNLRRAQDEEALLDKQKKSVAYYSSPEGQKFLKDRHDLELQQLEYDEELETKKVESEIEKRNLREKIKTQQDIQKTIDADLSDDQLDIDAQNDRINKKLERLEALKQAAKTTLKGVVLGVATVAEEALSRAALPLELRESAQISTQMTDLMQQRRKLDPDDPKYADLTEQIGQKESSLKESLVDTATLGLAPVARELGKQEVQRSDELRKVFGIPQSKQQSNNTNEQVNNLLQQP
tara:strand:+ start:105 stop:1916 length:1812 start_codon:yes stop_codon:yes gene_type:complete